MGFNSALRKDQDAKGCFGFLGLSFFVCLFRTGHRHGRLHVEVARLAQDARGVEAVRDEGLRARGGRLACSNPARGSDTLFALPTLPLKCSVLRPPCGSAKARGNGRGRQIERRAKRRPAAGSPMASGRAVAK